MAASSLSLGPLGSSPMSILTLEAIHSREHTCLRCRSRNVALRQHDRYRRHGDRRLHDAGADRPGRRFPHLGADRRWPRHRRRHRCGHGEAHTHDVDAGVGSGLSQPGRHGGRLRRGRRPLCAGSVRHRQARCGLSCEPARDGARRRHRRHHLHRLRHRLRQTVGASMSGKPIILPLPPPHQPRPRSALLMCARLLRSACRAALADAVLGHHG